MRKEDKEKLEMWKDFAIKRAGIIREMEITIGDLKIELAGWMLDHQTIKRTGTINEEIKAIVKTL